MNIQRILEIYIAPDCFGCETARNLARVVQSLARADLDVRLPARLATLLLREADMYGTIDGYTHQDLAERLGTYRETVSQLLGRFRAKGLVPVEPKRISLLDRSGLEAYAET